MSLEISKLKGVSIKLHFTLIIILAFYPGLSSGFMTRFYPNLDPLMYWIIGIAGAIIFLVSSLSLLNFNDPIIEKDRILTSGMMSERRMLKSLI